MSVTFKSIHKLSLRVLEHFQFHTRFKNAISPPCLAYLPTSARTYFNQTYVPAYNNLDAGVSKFRKSAFTELIMAKDAERDEAFYGMLDANNSAKRHFDPDIRESARRLDVLFGVYGNIAKKTLDEETAAIYNFLQDLRGPVYLADATTVGLIPWAAVLENRNFAVINYLKQREDEAAERPEVDIRQARAALDAAYNHMTVLIEAFIVLGEGSAESLAIVTQFVKSFNKVIKRYNDRLSKRKGGGADGGGDDDDDIDDGGDDAATQDGQAEE